MLFEKNIEILNLNVSGIKCDTPRCNYRDDSVTIAQYPEYVNSTCPKCSSILLTTDDFALVNRIVNLTKFINGVMNFIIPNYFLQKMAPATNDSVTMLMEMDGTGKISEVKKEKYNG